MRSHSTRLPAGFHATHRRSPGRAAVDLKAETIAQIADGLPTLVGIKHAANDLGLVTALLTKLGPDFRVFVGLEELSFPMLALGASGLMPTEDHRLPMVRATAELAERLDGVLRRGGLLEIRASSSI